ncbi:MAG: spore germination protein [Marinisporobacter sp.]|nr:spore germination protein [Marinisporobacter sp.]
MKQKKNLIAQIKNLNLNNLSISTRRLLVAEQEIFILYVAQLTDREKLSQNIIKPILACSDKKNLTLTHIACSVIYIDDVSIDENENNLIDYILKGNTIVCLTNHNQYLVANLLKVEKRSVQSPELQNSLRGPKDSFTENLETNLSLIRYRIKDPSLKIDFYTIGKRTQTSVAVVYIHDIINPNYVSKVKKKLEMIHIDGILESGYIQKFLLNNPFHLFPQVGIVERSDIACANLLDGKLCILVEGSNIALILPKTFIEFLDSDDDHYDNLFLSIFLKFIRLLALLISLTLSALYVALVSFHTDILPPQYILALATSRITVPFNALVETIIMEFVAEILREASIRLPKQIGPAIGIVGTIVIGQAAVSAGLVSPLMVIIVSLSTMSSFIAPDYTIMNPLRLLKYLLILLTGSYGLFGFTMGFTLIIGNLVSITTFGIPYVSPLAPFNFKDLKDYILSDITLSKKRHTVLNTKDHTRQ